MAPAISIQIPIYIRNTFAPLEGGTRIFVPRAKGIYPHLTVFFCQIVAMNRGIIIPVLELIDRWCIGNIMCFQFDKFDGDCMYWDFSKIAIISFYSLGELMREKCVCGFSTVDNISLLNIEGTGMIGVPGIAQRLFGKPLFCSISVFFLPPNPGFLCRWLWWMR